MCLPHYLLQFRVPAFKVVVDAAVSDLRDVPERRRKVARDPRASEVVHKLVMDPVQ